MAQSVTFAVGAWADTLFADQNPQAAGRPHIGADPAVADLLPPAPDGSRGGEREILVAQTEVLGGGECGGQSPDLAEGIRGPGVSVPANGPGTPVRAGGDGTVRESWGATAAAKDAAALQPVAQAADWDDVALADLDPSSGFTILGGPGDGQLGYSVASAGDVNGDGIDDLIVGVPFHDRTADDAPTIYDTGAAYVIFGGTDLADIDVTALTPSQGFMIEGDLSGENAGWCVASAGDVNGDGYDDLIIGVPADHTYTSGTWVGAAYVVLGGASPAQVDLSAPDPDRVIAILGANDWDLTGQSVASAGDLNGDGYDDMIVSSNYTELSGNPLGRAYVIFGAADLGDIDLAALAPSEGFTITGDYADRASECVASAGDINGDGYDDLIIGAPDEYYSGKAYVIFGGTDLGDIDLAALAPEDGFLISSGGQDFDGAGSSVASAGDINGDGYDDLLVGVPFNGGAPGTTYVVYGKADAGPVVLSALGPDDGFAITGDAAPYAPTAPGFSVASAGDFNGDGYDDLIIGDPYNDDGGPDAGAAYVIFGGVGLTDIDLTNLDPAQGFMLTADIAYGYAGFSVASVGDINGDGLDDVIVGVPQTGAYAGAAYVIYGTVPGQVFDGTSGPDSLTGTPGDDTMTGEGDQDTIAGEGGDDLIYGDTGSDVISGDAGADSIDAGQGADEVDGGDGDDTIAGKDGRDTIAGGAGADSLDGGQQSDTITGGDGNDTINGVSGGDHIDGGAGDDVISGDSGSDILIGGDGNDTLVGGQNNDTLDGGAGDDDLDGRDGQDSMTGGEGADTMIGKAGADTMQGDGGADWMDGGTSGDLMSGGTDDDYLYGNTNNDTISGDDGQDTVAGGNGRDLLDGGAGDDSLDGGNGHDTIEGGAGNDTVLGGAGKDQLDGGTGDDLLDGGDGNDSLYSSGGNDTLLGGAGDDYLAADGSFSGIGGQVLDGGAGDDTLRHTDGDVTMTGGAGADWFGSETLGSGDILILDFEDDVDTFYFEASGGLYGGLSEADFIDELVGSATVTGGNVTVTSPSGDGSTAFSVTFVGISDVADIVDDFVFM